MQTILQLDVGSGDGEFAAFSRGPVGRCPSGVRVSRGLRSGRKGATQSFPQLFVILAVQEGEGGEFGPFDRALQDGDGEGDALEFEGFELEGVV